PVEVGAQLDQHLGGHALALADQPQQDVLGADVVVAQLQRLPQRQLQHLLGAGRERDVATGCLLALTDDLLDLLPHALEGDAQALQGLGSHTLTLVDEAEQDVLRADVVVVEHPGLFLGQDDNPPCSVGEPLEHPSRSSPACGNHSAADVTTSYRLAGVPASLCHQSLYSIAETRPCRGPPMAGPVAPIPPSRVGTGQITPGTRRQSNAPTTPGVPGFPAVRAERTSSLPHRAATGRGDHT